jgi:hypothetical protein
VHSPTVSYTPRTDATQEAGLNVRASVYRFILDSRAKKNAAGVISTNGDDAKGSQHDRASGQQGNVVAREPHQDIARMRLLMETIREQLSGRICRTLSPLAWAQTKAVVVRPTCVSSRAIMSCLEVGYLLREIIRLPRLIAPPKDLAIPS